jgi:putative PIN family toxin of toxin-antitoxin system
MKIVLDTNVFVSSFFGGNPRRIIDLWKTGEISLCLTPPIIEEYIDVLRRLGLAGEPELEELLSLFARGIRVLFTSKTPRLKVVRVDPADDKFIECAVALKAECIVTGDKALRDIGTYMGIKFVNPREFLRILPSK